MQKNGSVPSALASSTARPSSSSSSSSINLFRETVIRLALFGIYCYFEMKEPFERIIHPEEMWLYKNPRTESYVPLAILYPVAFGVTGVLFIGYFLRTRDYEDFKCAWLGFSLSCTLNGALTDTIKVAVGRPRPDFFYRCFPDGQMNEDMKCSGNHWDVLDGRKSFPSGHSSFSFAALGFVSWYLFAKLQVFTERGRGHSWRLVAALAPLFAALMVAISRTCDYHHHWQDVTVGSLLGLAVGYVCYRQYYPALDSRYCYVPFTSEAALPLVSNRKATSKPEVTNNETESESKMLLEDNDRDSKWT